MPDIRVDEIKKMVSRMRRQALKMALHAGNNGAHLGVDCHAWKSLGCCTEGFST